MELLLSALSQGLLYAPMALGVFVAFRILNTPDLTIDGSMVFGMSVCAAVTIAGHPVLALFAGALAGALAGLVTGLLQTALRINPILAGILTMTGLYTVNFSVLGRQANVYLQSGQPPVASATVYRSFQALFPEGTNPNLPVAVLTAVIVACVCAAMCVFFRTRPGMAIRATGDNEEMVRSSSINADGARIAGVMLSNALVALTGSLLCQQQRYADIDSGSGMLVVGLASVIIGQVFARRGGVTLGAVSAVLGSVLYRLIIQIAYSLQLPSYWVKLLSAVIVALALAAPVVSQRLRESRLEREEAAGYERRA